MPSYKLMDLPASWILRCTLTNRSRCREILFKRSSTGDGGGVRPFTNLCVGPIIMPPVCCDRLLRDWRMPAANVWLRCQPKQWVEEPASVSDIRAGFENRRAPYDTTTIGEGSGNPFAHHFLPWSASVQQKSSEHRRIFSDSLIDRTSKRARLTTSGRATPGDHVSGLIVSTALYIHLNLPCLRRTS
jgi:hypothetical protein